MTGKEEQRLRDLDRPRRVRDRIDREYAQPLDVEALARGVHMSAGHLGRRFRLAYGQPPYAYLTSRGIERPVALLRRGDLSVTEVCSAVGCSSLGTFSARFTELVGVPPSVYREWAALARADLPSCIARQVIGPPGQPDTSIVLHPPAVDPGITEDERRTIRDMMAKGTYGGIILATGDLDATFRHLEAAAAEVVQEPMEQPWGVRDGAAPDPAGNPIRIQEVR